MKNNLLITLLLVTGVLISCTDKKAKSNASEVPAEQIEEIKQLEQENQNLDQIQHEIESSSKALDALLNEINN